MKNRNLSLLVISIFVISLAANAQQGNRGQQWRNLPPDQKAMMMEKRQQMQKSDRQSFFTEEQKETMKEIHLQTAKQVKPLKNELRELAAHQRTLSTAETADLKAINKNIDKMSELKADLAKIMAKQHQEVRSLLSEEQLLRFDAMKEKQGKGKRGDIKRHSMRKGERPAFGRGV